MSTLWSRLATKSLLSSNHIVTNQPKHGLYLCQSMLFSSKKKKLPKKWKPTTTMFVPSKSDPGKYVLSKRHNIKYEYDPHEQQSENVSVNPDEPSLMEEIEAAMEKDVDQEECEEIRFMQNYKWIIVSMISMVATLMGGFMLGFTRIKFSDLTDDDKETQKQSKIWYYLSKLQGDESIVKNKHKAMAQILLDLQNTSNDCVLMNLEERYKNKLQREEKYLEMFDKNEVEDNPQMFEQKLSDRVMNKKWGNIDLSEFTVDDIEKNHWNFGQYIQDIQENDIRLQFVPPLDAMRYGEAKKKKLLWIYSNKHLEWFQVVMSFSNSKQRIQDLNYVAIRLRFREFYCYPLLNEDGTADTKQWLIEKKKYQPRIEHLRRLQRHKQYYKKKYYNRVDPAKYELDVDEGIIDYYGRNIFAKEGEDDSILSMDQQEDKLLNEQQTEEKSPLFGKVEEEKLKDEELVKFVDKLEARLEKRRKLQQAQGINSDDTPLQPQT